MDEETDGRNSIRFELSRIEESCTYSAQGQFEAAKMWRKANLFLGSAAAVLSAVAGSTVLASDGFRLVVGALALGAAFIGAVVTTVNPSHRETQATEAAKSYQVIQATARQAREIDLTHATYAEARAELAHLTDRWQAANQAAPPIPKRAYERARRNIDAGGQSFAIDEGNST
ncbi:SLATT domain-containing protein [Streptomyces pilosus]